MNGDGRIQTAAQLEPELKPLRFTFRALHFNALYNCLLFQIMARNPKL